jgi:phosphopantothenoylcysteine decarboxylase/phosphopantothenate--cysteine ligase
MALTGLRVLLGVSGGIAAYKAAELVRRLRERGAEVRVVMTESATRFITPLTLQALSGHPVRTALWDEAAEAAMSHIELARWAQQIVIAPASANTLARLAHGLADDLLSTVCLASTAPLAVAPAMNHQMWAHPATQANIAILRTRGVTVLGPVSGDQACGETGPGRLLEPVDLLDALADARTPRVLPGVRVLITAGPTYEDLDPVRYLGNRSSGRMGFALARAAAAAGAEVTLIAGPSALPTSSGVNRVDVRSAADMALAVRAQIDAAQVFIAAAAVADFAPASTAAHKIKKSGGSMTLRLVPTIDILAEVGARKRRPFLVGFAAETRDLQRHARAKLAAKRLDLICANQVGLPGTGFEAEDNALLLLWPGGQRQLAQAPKMQLARVVIEEIARLRAARAPRRRKRPV